MSSDFLSSIRKQFAYYKQLGDQTFDQLNDEQLFWRPNEQSNSIAIIVKHLWGNMLSRWTEFLTTDGEKEWRQREAEFDADIQSRKELLQKWNKGWDCLFQAIDPLQPEDMNRIVYIRNQGHTVAEAIHRQAGHYPYHIGQIVFIGKMLKGRDWSALSIPRGGSAAFNDKKFAQSKDRGHFSDDFLNTPNN